MKRTNGLIDLRLTPEEAFQLLRLAENRQINSWLPKDSLAARQALQKLNQAIKEHEAKGDFDADV